MNEVSSPVPRAGLSVRAQLAMLVLLAALLPALLVLASYLSGSHRLMQASLLVSAVMPLLAIAMAWRVGAGIHRSTQCLTNVVTRVAQGDTSARVSDTNGPAELVIVLRQLNRMLDARDESERQLRLGQAQALDLFEHSPAGIVVCSADGAILRCNPVARALLGPNADQFLGKLPTDPCWRFCRSDGSPLPIDEHPVHRVLADGQAVGDLEIGQHRGDGEQPVWRLCSARPVHDETGRITQVVMVLVDVTERHRAQDAQQCAHERLELILRGIDAAPWDWDLRSGEVYFAPRWWHMLGYEVDELPGQATLWASLCHPDDAAYFDATLSAALSGNAASCQLQYRLRHKGGHDVPVLTRAHIRRDAQGKAVRLSGVNADLTEPTRTQAQLRESEGRYQALVEWSPIGIGVHQNGRVVYANPAALRMLGADSLQQLIGTPMVDRVHPDYRKPVLERAAHTPATHDPMPWREEKLLRMDGVAIDVEIQGTRIAHLGEPAIQVSMVDITERKKAQSILRQSEARFRALTELSSDWFWEQDAQLRYVHISAQLQDISGLTPANYLGLTCWETAHRGVSDAQWAAHRTALRRREAFYDFEMQRPGRGGGWVWVSVSGAPIVDEQGLFTGYWGVGRDITERKQAEQLLRDSQNQYQALVEWSPLGMSVHQDGKIVYVNPAAVRLWAAATADELVGTPIEARVHPQFMASTMARMKGIVERGVHAPLRQSKFLRLDGRAIDVETQGMPIQYRGEPAVLSSFQDITARKQTENTLRESEERFRALTELSSDWYWEQDEHFRFVMLSGDVAVSTGLTGQQHVGKTHWELPALNLSDSDWQRHRAVVQAHQEFRDFEIRRPDGGARMHWASVSGTPMFDGGGVFRGYRGIGRDITPQKQAADQIHRLAFYDALTGLPNRRLLIEQLKKAVQINVRHGLRGALLFIDLDNFKTLNDTLGHDVGDVLLQQVAKRLVECVREADTVARLGGDEFVVVLEDLNEDALDAASQADAVGHKILSALNAPYQLAGRDHRSSPSIGVTLFGAQDHGVDELLKQADLAMYQAKGAGRNTLRFFDAGMQSEVDERAALESDLRDGLQGGEELALRFQPVVGADGRVIGAEVLVRWLQPQRGLVMPADFIALAESTGLILPLGRWVMQAACEQLAVWARRVETAHLTLAVNVSARELREPDFVSQTLQVLQRTGAPPGRLRLELTESVLAHRVEDIILKMTELKRCGVGFSLDDFGTGYSSLSYLKLLPLDLLKIDRSFVRDVLTDPNDAAIARTIVALGQSLGLSVVAEGVETEAQRAFLAANGCFTYQGYLFGEPMPIAAFDAFVAGAA
ncbi:PAS domain S-box protein [Rhodoferax sp.]|uniref:sensor domain-containing protein n=1 Tax=Rhodoferax sp. TaxID=50421 RepID=UPI002775D2C3|nr:PAS domain S-box protein [Rhodoferax sp.]